MKQYETRTEYMDAIARALGLGDRDDLSFPHRDMLQVENHSRLAPILDMIEIAAGRREQQAAADDAEALTEKLIAVGQVLERHRDSKVKAVQTLIEEIEAVLDGEEARMEAFPSLDELLLNPVVAAAAVVAAVNVISYAAGGVKPTWLAVVTVSLAYMVGGYLVTGRSAPDQLFLAVVYALLIVAPLAHVDGAVLHRLFGNPVARQLRIVGEPGPRSLFQEWL
jgi:hypothetical protein